MKPFSSLKNQRALSWGRPLKCALLSVAVALTVLPRVSFADDLPTDYVAQQNMDALKAGRSAGYVDGFALVDNTIHHDCVNFFYSQNGLNDSAQRVADFKIDSTDFYTLGVQLGWLKGYQHAVKKFASECEADLQQAEHVSIENRLAECKAILDRDGQLPPVSLEKMPLPVTSDAADLENQLVDMAQRGEQIRAWTALLDLTDRNEQNTDCLGLWPLTK